MKIHLLDIDGVLVHPFGYHAALIATLAQVSRALGFAEVRLDADEIARFEACGVASEWESVAICTALMLVRAWQRAPELVLPAVPPLPALAAHGLPPPDFTDFMERIAGCARFGEGPLAHAERLILGRERLQRSQQEAIAALLRGARKIDGAVTHRLFQELALGDERFERSYGLPASARGASLLLLHDRPTLTAAQQAALREQFGLPAAPSAARGPEFARRAERAALLSGRPSRGPDGRGAPEAELGATVAGLPELGIVGLGELGWLAEERGLSVETLLKPSPVHALAAMALALGEAQEAALRCAAALALDRSPSSIWARIEGAQVCVYEDSTAGMQSAIAARDCLEDAGRSIQLSLCGVTADARKREALEAIGAEVSADLARALSRVRC